MTASRQRKGAHGRQPAAEKTPASIKYLVAIGVLAGAVLAWELGGSDGPTPQLASAPARALPAPAAVPAATRQQPALAPQATPDISGSRPGAPLASAPAPVDEGGVRVIQNGPGAFESALQQAMKNTAAERAAARSSPFTAL